MGDSYLHFTGENEVRNYKVPDNKILLIFISIYPKGLKDKNVIG